jgi:cell division septum initiation protein DivIVA
MKAALLDADIRPAAAVTCYQHIADARQIERRARIEADVLLAQASQKADWIIADAKAHAQTLLHNAEDWHTIERADEAVTDLIEQAREAANDTLERARRAADDILIKARRQSEQITSDARLRAESLERDAQNRHRQAMGTLPQTRKELEQRVDDLRAFEREYRRRLIEYMEGQVRDLRAGAADSGTFPAISTSPQQHVVTGP